MIKAALHEMKTFRTTTLVLGIVMVCFICRLSLGSEPEEDFRVRQAREELSVLTQVAKSVTNQTERAHWDKRVRLAAKSLSHVQRLVALEKKEQAFASGREMGVDEALRNILATIETDTAPAKQEMAKRNTAIRDLKAKRAEAERLLASEDMVKSPDKKIETRGRIHNLDADILVHMIARDVEELRVRLAKEAERIDTLRRSFDLSTRITIRSLFRKTQGITFAQQNTEEFALLKERLEAHRKETLMAVDLAKERFAQLDDEIRLLSDQLKMEQRGAGDKVRSVIGRLWRPDSPEVNRLREMTSQAKSGKILLQERIGLLQTQAEFLHRQLGLVDQGLALFAGEKAFTEYQLLVSRSRYFRRIVIPFGVVVALALVYLLISRAIFPRIFAEDHLFVSRRLGRYVLWLLIVLVLTVSFLEDLKAIATVMGIVGAAIVIALQDLCSSFAGWFVIVSSGKVRVGDRVEIAGHRGDVIDVQILRTVLLELNNWLGVDEPTGRTVVIPNSFIFKNHVFNYSHVHPYIWGTVDITVTFESNPEEAEALLYQVLEEETREEFQTAMQAGSLMEKHYGKTRTVYEPRIHTVIVDSGACFSLFYVTHFKRFAATRDKIMSRILKEFNLRPNLNFAYPTERHIPTPDPAPGVKSSPAGTAT